MAARFHRSFQAELAVFVCALLAASCRSPLPVDRLPTWPMANAGSSLAPIPCFDADTVDPSQLPQAVPYAVAHDENAGQNLTQSARRMCAALLEESRPDFIVVQDLGSIDTGTISQFWGNGLITERRIFARMREAIAWRLAKVELGFDARPEDGVIVRAPSPEYFQGEAALQEGDELLSIDGVPFRFGERLFVSPHWKRILELRPGDECELIWLRPGFGRMAGRMRPPAVSDQWRSLPTVFVLN